MTLPRKRKKVKQKKRILRKKRQIYSSKKKRVEKKKRGKKKRLVLNTNAKIKKLEKQLAAEKRKVKALRKRGKKKSSSGKRRKSYVQRAIDKERKHKKKPEPGALLSERSEAAKRGWTKRRAKQAKTLHEFIQTSNLPEEDRNELEKIAKRGIANRKLLLDTFIKHLPDYLIRKDKEEFLVERKENMILHRLIVARALVGNFDDTAYEIAEEYDLEPYEVYSLWHGYTLED